VTVTSKIRADTALALRRGVSSPHADAIRTTAAQFGAKIVPLNPSSEHPVLLPYFAIEVPDQNVANALIQRLVGLQDVEAAYIQPQAELP
jgi:hypothetical protein